MALSSAFKVDFSKYARDLVSQALDRMLSQHYDKCVLRQFVAVFIEECQLLYDACIELQRLRTPYYAEGQNLDALGRIVGEDRTPWEYDDSMWFFFDRQGQSYEQSPVWVKGAPVGTSRLVDDYQYRVNIIAKAIKNHTLTSSVPELTDLIKLLFSTDVSFEKTGPNQVRIIATHSTSLTQLRLLTRSYDDAQAVHRWFMNYPATLDLARTVLHPDGDDFFIFDVQERGWDDARVSTSITEIGVV